MCGSSSDKAAGIFADNRRVIALFDQGNIYIFPFRNWNYDSVDSSLPTKAH